MRRSPWLTPSTTTSTCSRFHHVGNFADLLRLNNSDVEQPSTPFSTQCAEIGDPTLPWTRSPVLYFSPAPQMRLQLFHAEKSATASTLVFGWSAHRELFHAGPTDSTCSKPSTPPISTNGIIRQAAHGACTVSPSDLGVAASFRALSSSSTATVHPASHRPSSLIMRQRISSPTSYPSRPRLWRASRNRQKAERQHPRSAPSWARPRRESPPYRRRPSSDDQSLGRSTFKRESLYLPVAPLMDTGSLFRADQFARLLEPASGITPSVLYPISTKTVSAVQAPAFIGSYSFATAEFREQIPEGFVRFVGGFG